MGTPTPIKGRNYTMALEKITIDIETGGDGTEKSPFHIGKAMIKNGDSEVGALIQKLTFEMDANDTVPTIVIKLTPVNFKFHFDGMANVTKIEA